MSKIILGAIILLSLSCSSGDKRDKNSPNVVFHIKYTTPCKNSYKKPYKEYKLNETDVIEVSCFKDRAKGGFAIPWKYTEGRSDLMIAERGRDAGAYWESSAFLFLIQDESILWIREKNEDKNSCTSTERFYKWNIGKKIFIETQYKGELPPLSVQEKRSSCD